MSQLGFSGSPATAFDQTVLFGSRRPRLGFMGTGWIGRLRMEALSEVDCADFCAVYDPSPEAARAAAAIQGDTDVVDSIDALLDAEVDGIVVATPSAMHAEQCRQALHAGKAVFCQKPLARNREETAAVIECARQADKLLAVDFCYRHLAGLESLKQAIADGELGDIFAADLVFHNAYGPDKDWFYDLQSAGGGCVMDLGIHLVDSLFWLLDCGRVNSVESRLYRQGQPLRAPYTEVEDYASADLMLGDTHARLSCSWNLHAGQDAVIETRLYGTRGGAAIRNVNGSFFDFEVQRFAGTDKWTIAGYPDPWGGRALTAWVQQLADDESYDPAVARVLQVADLIDRIYCR